MYTIYAGLYKLYSQFAAITPLFSPMARFCILFTNNHHYASSSDLLDIMTCQQKRSVSSILCTVQFLAGKLQFWALFSCRTDTWAFVKQRPLEPWLLSPVLLWHWVAHHVICQQCSSKSPLHFAVIMSRSTPKFDILPLCRKLQQGLFFFYFRN
jgi:hypothetical protein